MQDDSNPFSLLGIDDDLMEDSPDEGVDSDSDVEAAAAAAATPAPASSAASSTDEPLGFVHIHLASAAGRRRGGRSGRSAPAAHAWKNAAVIDRAAPAAPGSSGVQTLEQAVAGEVASSQAVETGARGPQLRLGGNAEHNSHLTVLTRLHQEALGCRRKLLTEYAAFRKLLSYRCRFSTESVDHKWVDRVFAMPPRDREAKAMEEFKKDMERLKREPKSMRSRAVGPTLRFRMALPLAAGLPYRQSHYDRELRQYVAETDDEFVRRLRALHDRVMNTLLKAYAQKARVDDIMAKYRERVELLVDELGGVEALNERLPFRVNREALTRDSPARWLFRLQSRADQERLARERKKRASGKRSSKLAMLRLARDLEECEAGPLKHVVARPVFGNDFFVWHGNLRGEPGTEYAGVVFHLELTFPKDYPHSPPKISMLTTMPARHVYGRWICLDLLDKVEDRWPGYYHLNSRNANDVTRQKKKVPYVGGWTPGYTVQSVLLQLQSFLWDGVYRIKPLPSPPDCEYSDAHVVQPGDSPRTKAKKKRLNKNDTKARAWATYHREVARVRADNKRIRDIIAQAKKFECPCGHKHDYPFPELPPLTDEDLERAEHEAHPLSLKEHVEIIESSDDDDASQPSDSGNNNDDDELPPPPPPVAPQVLDMHSSAASSSLVTIKRRVPVSAGYSRPRRRRRIPKSQLRVGADLEGTVVSIRPYGAFVDVGCSRDALLHISQLTSERFVEDIADVLSVGDVLDVHVRDVTEADDGQRISLTLLSEDPEAARRRAFGTLEEGQPVLGRVVGWTDFAALVQLEDENGTPLLSTHALLDLSQLQLLAAGRHVWSPGQVVHLDQRIELVVDELYDPNRGRRRRFRRPVRVSVRLGDALLGEADRQREDRERSLALVSSASRMQRYRKRDTAVRRSGFAKIGGDAVCYIMSFLDRTDLVRMARTCHSLRDSAEASLTLYWIRQDLRCFFTRSTLDQDMIGMPLTLEHYENNGELANIVPHNDLVSWTAFVQHGVRKGVWKQGFDAWLPLYLSSAHSKDLLLAERCIADICRNKGALYEHAYFMPAMALKVIPSLMNTFIVRIMEGSLFDSMLALEGYMSAYHLLLAFAEKYPDEIVGDVDQRLALFLSGERGRNKRVCPNLGELLAMLSVSAKYTWDDVAFAVVREVFDRQVKWVLKAFPELVDADNGPKGVDGEHDQRPSKSALLEEQRRIVEEQHALWREWGLQEYRQSKTAKRNLRRARKRAEKRAQQERERMAAQMAEELEAEDDEEEEEEELLDSTGVGEGANPDLSPSNAKQHKKTRKHKGTKLADSADVVVLDNEDSDAYLTMDRGRLPKTFRASTVSLRLLMFHVFFLRTLRYEDKLSVTQVKRKLDQSYGRSTPTMQRKLQLAVRRIKRVDTWQRFFRAIHMPAPTRRYLCSWLRQAAVNSARRRYHRPHLQIAANRVELEKKRQEREEAKLRASGAHVIDEDEAAHFEQDRFEGLAEMGF